MWVSFCILNLCLLLKYDSPVVLALGCAESGCGVGMEQFLTYRKGLLNISSLGLASIFRPRHLLLFTSGSRAAFWMDSVAHRCDGHMHIHRRLCLEEETEVSRGTGSHQELFLLVSSREASSLSVCIYPIPTKQSIWRTGSFFKGKALFKPN